MSNAKTSTTNGKKAVKVTNSAQKQPSGNTGKTVGGKEVPKRAQARKSAGPALQTPKKSVPPQATGVKMATKYVPSKPAEQRAQLKQALQPVAKQNAQPTSAQINRAITLHSMRVRKVNAFRSAFHAPIENMAYPGFDNPKRDPSLRDKKVSFVANLAGVPSTLKTYEGFPGLHSTDPRIPRTSASHALSASSTPGGHSEQIQRRLKGKSPWYSSIMDPLHGADCKIPDTTGEETGTIQLIQKATVIANGNGMAGLRILTPYINEGSDTSTSINYQIPTPTASISPINIAWGDGANIGFNYGYPFTGAADIQGVTNAHRVVSMEMIVEHEASGLNNQGEMNLAAVPWQTAGSPLYSDHQNLYSAVQIPLNQNKPAVVRWFPMNRQAFNYTAFQYTNCDEVGQDDEPDTSAPVWTLEFLANGCASGITFKITMVVNYEFLPIYNTLNILSLSPSPVDVEEEQLVGNWVETMPVAEPGSDKRVNSSASTVSPQHGDEPTGFGMIANVISEIIPFVSLLL